MTLLLIVAVTLVGCETQTDIRASRRAEQTKLAALNNSNIQKLKVGMTKPEVL
jgi:outer membrane protein assembly factor BamE (lipoprotein component of BamABCDE complex)